MHRPTPLIAATIGALAVAGLGLATPARADLPPDLSPHVEMSTGTYTATSGCTPSVPDRAEKRPLALDGSPTSASFTHAQAVVDGAGKETRTSTGVSSTASARTRGGQLSTVDLSASGYAQITPEAGATCEAGTWAVADERLRFTLSRPRWVTVTATAGRDTAFWVEVGDDDRANAIELQSVGTGGTLSYTYLLPAGTYDLDVGIGWQTWVTDGTQSRRDAGSGRLALRLYDAGSAIAAPSGAGRAYLTPGPQTTCAAAAVPATFTGRGGRVRSASFLVNGTLRRTVRNPVAGQRVSVPGLGRYRTNTVSVRLNVDPPGDVRSATLTVRRTYRPCAVALG